VKIDRAIEVLTDLLDSSPTFPPDDRRDAVQLGVEALKRVKAVRPPAPSLAFMPLPGETDTLGRH